MNRVLLTAAFLAVPVAHASAATFYEGFNYEPGALAGNTNTSVTAPNPGDTTWTDAGAVTAPPSVAAGNLSYPGLAPPVGNRMAVDGTQNGGGIRLGFGNEYGAGAGGRTVYYSMIMNVADVAGITSTTSGSFYTALQWNPSAISNGGMSGTSNSGAAALTVHATDASSTAYNLGIAYRDLASARQFGTTAYDADDTLFLVVKYEIGEGNKDDVASLYVFRNDGTTVDAVPLSEPGSADVVSANTSDSANHDYFYNNSTGAQLESNVRSILFRSNSVEPDSTFFDELRVGATWSDVVAVPEPAGLALAGIGAMSILARRRRRAS